MLDTLDISITVRTANPKLVLGDLKPGTFFKFKRGSDNTFMRVLGESAFTTINIRTGKLYPHILEDKVGVVYQKSELNLWETQ